MNSLNLFLPITRVDSAKRIVYGTLTHAVADKSGEIIDYQSTKAAYQKWSDDAFERSKGKSKGNLRAMHGHVAAGKFTDIVFDDVNEKIEGAAYVSDDNEWAKCENGTYTGFSHGGSYAKRWTDPANPNLKRYTPELAEVSLVDNPCVPTATFEFIKHDGSTELRKFNTNQEAPMTDETTTDIEKAAAETVAEVVNTETAATEAVADAEPALIKETPGTVVEPPHTRDGVRQRWLAENDPEKQEHVTKSDALKRKQELEALALAAPALAALQQLNDAVAKAESKSESKAEESVTPTEELAVTVEPVAAAAVVDKAAAPAEVEKGMYSIGSFAQLLSSIQSLQADSQWEALLEGDQSALPAKLKDWLKTGGDLLRDMVAEETAELTGGEATDGVLAMAAAVDGLAKKGAALSAATKGHIEKMHQSAASHMGEMDKCYQALGLGEGTANKSEHPTTAAALERDALKKVLGDITPQLQALTKKVEDQQAEIKRLADQPLPAKGALRAVAKGADSGNVSDGDAIDKAQELLKSMSPDHVNMVLMKAALSKPLMNK